jgi:hypothetical protein
MINKITFFFQIIIALISIQIYSQSDFFEISSEPSYEYNYGKMEPHLLQHTSSNSFIVKSSLGLNSQKNLNDDSIHFFQDYYSFNLIEAKSIKFREELPYYDVTNANKLKKASIQVLGYNFTMGVFLIIAPESLTKWGNEDKLKIKSILKQYNKTYTTAPVFDKDNWYVNYIGHPYQGSFYYNSLRSQDLSFWNSSLFCIANTLSWEYLWEGGFEDPSIQDLILTPVIGSLLGELIHRATIYMSKDGFLWYEAVLVTALNPAYTINNRFAFNLKKSKDRP